MAKLVRLAMVVAMAASLTGCGALGGPKERVLRIAARLLMSELSHIEVAEPPRSRPAAVALVAPAPPPAAGSPRPKPHPPCLAAKLSGEHARRLRTCAT